MVKGWLRSLLKDVVKDVLAEAQLPPQEIPLPPVPAESVEEAPWIIADCSREKNGCGERIPIYSRILPGEVVVVVCRNCNASWSIYNAPLYQYRTEEFEPAWKHLQNDPYPAQVPV